MQTGQPSSFNRSRRGVATRACETCRKRKSKCDETRPKCTLCQRLDLVCLYKEADGTRKDEGVERVIEVLQRMELKLDNISASSTVNEMHAATARSPFNDAQHIFLSRSSHERKYIHEARSERRPWQIRPYLTVPHKIILWPTIYSQLIGINPEMEPELQAMHEGGTPWLIRHEIESQGHALPFELGQPQGLTADTGISRRGSSCGDSCLSLHLEDTQRFTDAYFGTFNMLYPILEYDVFVTETLQPAIGAGFVYGDSSSVLALLVLALGSLAAAACTVDATSGWPELLGDTRGSLRQNPPGLSLFNEARAKMGSIWFRCDHRSVQAQLLIATYFAANGRYIEYWQSTVTASMVCQVLALDPGVGWHTPKGDAIKRAYWTCVINEDFYHLDLDLPRTSIHQLEDVVPLPHFNETQHRCNPGTSEVTSIEVLSKYYFVAKASLKRMISRIHEAIHLHSNQSESLDCYCSPPIHVVQELSRQLESWRALLPAQLQWSDDEIYHRPDAEEQVSEVAGSFAEVGREVLTAELRTRFYYARHILYRPFIFKALHFPQLMNTQDEECCALAVRAACLWPMTMMSTKSKKFVVPHLFSWTQNFIALLLILWVSQNDARLGNICAKQLDPGLVEISRSLMLGWLADMKETDVIAEWGLRLLTPLFADCSH